MQKSNTGKTAKSSNSGSYIDIMEKNHMEIPWHDYANADSNVLICRQVLLKRLLS